MGRIELALCIVVTVMLALGQILMKLAAARVTDPQSVASYLSFFFVLAIGVYAGTTALWMYILTRVSLSLAYPFSLAGSCLVFVMAYFVLGEAMTPKQYIGLAVVFAGIVVIYV